MTVLFLLLALTGCYGRNNEAEGLEDKEELNKQTYLEENTESSGEINSEKSGEWEVLTGDSIPVEDQMPSGGDTEEPEISYEVLESDSTYFDDALFIGDSRTVGLREYGTLSNADFFATPGLSVYTVPKTKIAIGDSAEVSLEELLEQKDYGKIYLMLGMNELGYNFEQTVEQYRIFVEDLQSKEPDAILYLCANMHVTITRSENDEIHNNASINNMNAEIEKLAEEKNLPYLDVNILFDDENGNLNVEYTSDDSHVLGRYYESWCDWLQGQTVVKK